MASARKAFRIIFEVNGEKKSVLSARRQNDGTVILNTKVGDFFRESGVPIEHKSDSAHHGKKIIESRISIHPSENSKHKVTVIKLTQILEDGTEVTTSNPTRALKVSNNFEIIYSRRLNDLDDRRFSFKGSKLEEFLLGQLDTSCRTGIIMVCVGSANRLFNPVNYRQANVFQEIIGQFRVVVLWRFYRIPSHESGQLFIMLRGEYEHNTDLGENEAGVFSMFNQLCKKHMLEMLSTVEKQVSGNSEALEIIAKWHREFQGE